MIAKLKTLLEEIAARGGPSTTDQLAGLAAVGGHRLEVIAGILRDDLLERGMSVSTASERTGTGAVHSVTAGQFNASEDNPAIAVARVWLEVAEAEGWGSTEAEILRLEREIKHLKSQISSYRHDMLVLCNSVSDIKFQAKQHGLNSIWVQTELRNAVLRAQGLVDRHKLGIG